MNTDKQKKYKMGDPHPTDKNMVFHSYMKREKNSEYWISKERLLKWRGIDKCYSVYYLPAENYYGCTNRLLKRMWEHRKKGKITDGYIIVRKFRKMKNARQYETYLQLKNNANGYIYTESWRKKNSDNRKLNGEDKIYSKRRKPVICIDNGMVFKGVRDCENYFNAARGNLSKHLRNPKEYPSFRNLKFKFI